MMDTGAFVMAGVALLVLGIISGFLFGRSAWGRRLGKSRMDDLYLFRILMESSPDHIYFKDRESRFLRVNRAQAASFGLDDPAQAVGKTDLDFFPEAHAKKALADEQQILKTGVPLVGKKERTNAGEGGFDWALTTKLALRDPSGKTVGTFGISRDISGWNQAEKSLRFERNLLQSLMDNTPDYVFFKDRESRFIRTNKAHAELLGISDPQDAVGKNDSDFFPEEFARRFRKEDKEIMESGIPLFATEKEVPTREGNFLCRSEHKIPLRDADARIIGLIGISRDITDRKRMADMLARERDLLQVLMDHFPDTIYFKDAEGRFTRVNRAQADFLGLAYPEQAVGKTDFDFLEKGHAEKATDDERQIIRTGKPMISRAEKVQSGAGKTVWVSATKIPIRGPGGEVVGIVGMSRDITDRVEAEEDLRTYAEKLEMSNRELEGFAYVASHDLQEPLRKILAFGDRLKSGAGARLGDREGDYLARMQNAAMRMRILIEDLLSFSRVATRAKPFTQIRLEEAITEVVLDLEARIEELDAHIQVDCGKLVMDGDATQIRQLLQNLIANALKFHRENVAPQIHIRGEETGARQGIPGRRTCKIEIADNGIGFDQKYGERIFQVFQRLHSRSEYQGTGMGLAICKKIVERHHGIIYAMGTEGEGSRFVIVLPIRQPLEESV